MFEALSDPGAFAWPLALICTTVLAADRIRVGIAAGRRRELLNRATHELRRPIQALALAGGPPGRREQLELAIAALSELDRAINGEPGAPRSELVDPRLLVEGAVGRWRQPAALRGRRLELRWHANSSRVSCDPGAIARALDNLIANSLEHGSGPVRLEGAVRAGSLRLLVADGADAGGPSLPAPAARRPPALAPRRRSPRRRSDARRGHGLRMVAEIAAAHGGRFAACRHETGASAMIELPLARADRGRRSA